MAGDRQPNPEYGAGSGLVCREDLPVVCFHDGSRNRQSHAHALRLGGEKGLEHVLQLVGRDPRSAMESSAKFSAREVRRVTMRFSPTVPDIASIALMTRFRMTC